MKIESVRYFCDRCKKENKQKTKSYDESGFVLIKYNGEIESRDYNGNGAGIRLRGEKYLCIDCARKFLEFIDD